MKCKNCGHELYSKKSHSGIWHKASKMVIPLKNCKFCGCTNPEPCGACEDLEKYGATAHSKHQHQTKPQQENI